MINLIICVSFPCVLPPYVVCSPAYFMLFLLVRYGDALSPCGASNNLINIVLILLHNKRKYKRIITSEMLQNKRKYESIITSENSEHFFCNINHSINYYFVDMIAN